MEFPGGSDAKESTCNAEDLGSIPGLGRSPGGGNGNLLQYSCLENPHGQKSLAGYSWWARKESDMTKRLSTAVPIWLHQPLAMEIWANCFPFLGLSFITCKMGIWLSKALSELAYAGCNRSHVHITKWRSWGRRAECECTSDSCSGDPSLPHLGLGAWTPSMAGSLELSDSLLWIQFLMEADHRGLLLPPPPIFFKNYTQLTSPAHSQTIWCWGSELCLWKRTNCAWGTKGGS